MTIDDRSQGPDELVLEARLPAAPQVVFSWLVEPERLVKWWPSVAEVDLRVGGQYLLSWPKMGWHLRGRYDEVEPGSRLAFSWHWDHEPHAPVRHVVLELAPADGGTRLIVRHGVYAGGPGEATERQGHLEGWQHFLGVLAEQLRADGAPTGSAPRG